MDKKNLRCKKIISYKNMGDKLSLVNSTCHLCKSIITLEDFHPCKNKIFYNNINNNSSKLKKNKTKKQKKCNKIFCMNCYEKYFQIYLINSQFNSNSNLNCPSCEGLCTCKVCSKNKERQDLENENLILLNNKKNIINNNKSKKDSLNLKAEKLGNIIKSIFPNIDGESKMNKEKNSKIIPLIEPSEFQLIKQYNLNLSH